MIDWRVCGRCRITYSDAYGRWGALSHSQFPKLRVEIHVDTGIQTYETDLAADVDYDDWIGDYVLFEDEVNARFRDAHFGTTAIHYLS